MAQQDEQIKKLKNIIESEAPEKPKEEKQEELGKIVERLRARDRAKTQVFKEDEVEDSRLAQLKARIEGKTTLENIDFSKNSFSKNAKNQEFLSEKTLSLIGDFYSFFEWPVAKTASFFTKLPTTLKLKQDLDAANIQISTETYLVSASVLSIIISLMILVASMVITALLAPKLIGISVALSIVSFFATALLSLSYPASKANERAKKIDRELPFALRHLSSQIKAGVSFNAALKSVAKSDYGLLSLEFRHVLRDLDKGSSTEVALQALVNRTYSKGLRKALTQVIRSLRTGGNLSEIISGIADDVAFESRMQVRDFVETLNIVSVIYIMIGVVAPVILTILSSVAQLPTLGVNIPFTLIILIFALDIFAMFGIVAIIKKMEPTT